MRGLYCSKHWCNSVHHSSPPRLSDVLSASYLSASQLFVTHSTHPSIFFSKLSFLPWNGCWSPKHIWWAHFIEMSTQLFHADAENTSCNGTYLTWWESCVSCTSHWWSHTYKKHVIARHSSIKDLRILSLWRSIPAPYIEIMNYTKCIRTCSPS